MIPREAGRGRSFVGAGQYYLHDREAATSDRIGFTHTENVPTDDPHKALKWMAWTAIHAEDLKRESGATMNGQSCSKPVFTFSLSWHPEEDPQKWDMIRAGRTALASLGLDKHETLMVSHTDREHPHMHVIVNVVDPETGKAHSLSFSRKKLSEWAEDYERERGKIYCDQRVENNAKRQQGEYVKYREPEVDPKTRITELYQQSDSGAAFQAGLAELGYTLAQGKRVVLIDQKGKIHSLSRQIDGVKAKDVRTKLADLELPDLDTARARLATPIAEPSPKLEEEHEPPPTHGRSSPTQEVEESEPSPAAQQVSEATSATKQTDVAEPLDRDRQHRDWQESTIDTAIASVEGESDKSGGNVSSKQSRQPDASATEPAPPGPVFGKAARNERKARETILGPTGPDHGSPDGNRPLTEVFHPPDRLEPSPSDLKRLQDRHLAELGRFYEENTRARAQLNSTLEQQYGEYERQLRHEVDHLDGLLKNSGRVRLWWLKLTDQIPKNPDQELNDIRQSLKNVEWRQREARDALECDVARRRREIETQQLRERAEVTPASGGLEQERSSDPDEGINRDENPGPWFEY